MPVIPLPPQTHRVVCIDPGHPSEVGRGTQGKRFTEIQIAWMVAKVLKADLEKEGIQVVLTKNSENQFVKNRRRAEIANEAHADLMVRLHCDAANGSGFTTYYPDRQGRSQGRTGPSKELLKIEAPIARMFQTELAKDLHGFLADNGLKGDEQTAVGRGQGALTGSIFSEVPVVLVEMVVLTNRTDEAKVSTPEGRARLGDALAKATLKVLESR